MRTEDLPVTQKDTSLKDAIVIMSRGRLGHILMTDESGALVALLSDGDLRRALMKKDFSLDERAIVYANQTPTSYTNTELLASEALEIIEEKKIQLLPITTEEKKLIGVLHIHDLVNAGIKSK